MAREPASGSMAGWLYGVAAYLIWGFAPLYWRLLDDVPAIPLLAWRVVFSALLVAGLVIARRRVSAWRRNLQARSLLVFAAAAGLLGTNWFLFLYAVLNDRVMEAALGYFINPLVNVALGTAVLAERPRTLQWVAIALASVGVASFAWAIGGVPWISLLLALSFGLYGLMRKTATPGALDGSALEMVFLFPAALMLLLISTNTRSNGWSLPPSAVGDWLLLSASALITVSPLLLFAKAARLLPLSSVGFLQYIAPTCQFLLAVLVLGEAFDLARGIAFLWIWTGLAVFSWDLLRHYRTGRSRPPTPQPA